MTKLAENNPQGTANIADDRVLAVVIDVWYKCGEIHPPKEYHGKQILVEIDWNYGYAIARWDYYNRKFYPDSYQDTKRTKALFTGISRWRIINNR
jgi:hypothetical protein